MGPSLGRDLVLPSSQVADQLLSSLGSPRGVHAFKGELAEQAGAQGHTGVVISFSSERVAVFIHVGRPQYVTHKKQALVAELAGDRKNLEAPVEVVRALVREVGWGLGDVSWDLPFFANARSMKEASATTGPESA